MLVVPLILTSIIYAIVNLGQQSGSTLRKLSICSIGMLLLMTALSSAIAIGVGLWLHVGKGLQLPAYQLQSHHAYTGMVDTLLGMLPANPIAAMANGNTVAMVIFALLLGSSAYLLMQKDAVKAQPFVAFVDSAFAVVKHLASIVISITPYGVLALMASVGLEQGATALVGRSSIYGSDVYCYGPCDHDASYYFSLRWL